MIEISPFCFFLLIAVLIVLLFRSVFKLADAMASLDINRQQRDKKLSEARQQYNKDQLEVIHKIHQLERRS